MRKLIPFSVCANVGNTPLDGLWTDWKAWSNCSAACGNGSMTRTRTCTNPSPSLGGRDCEGSDNETKDCMMMECPVDGNWTDWQAWGNCSETCGNGVRIRNRTCENPSPSSGGNDCEGSASDTQNCTLIPCPINGNWGSWQIWSDCSTTCGVGVMNRSRECDNPPPQYDGEDCVGPASETSTCANITCPPPGTWNNWSTWTDCSVSCGQGISRKTRTCDDSAGGDCIGADLETKGCQIFKCYDSWGIWSDCSLTCGAGLRSRNRTCDGKYTGQECGWHTPTFVDVKSCDNTATCPDSFCASRSANCSYNHPNRCDMYITCDARKVMHEQICNVLLLYKVRQSDECKGDCDWAANVQWLNMNKRNIYKETPEKGQSIRPGVPEEPAFSDSPPGKSRSFRVSKARRFTTTETTGKITTTKHVQYHITPRNNYYFSILPL
ncbi:coadhesin-like [Ylistrum balloti]|uniref:coadhesin-like n=1 Tax=Ylistrum balloti TaxID=509963 RepID=UPI0029058F80|nr:coadhesin-like [Ylistrum balloti]